MDLFFDFNTPGVLPGGGLVKTCTKNDPPTATKDLGSRVCDRCIQRKVKCDFHRPTCSRCTEGNWKCVYSSSRRKPGPAKGTRRKAQATAAPKRVDYNLQQYTPPASGSESTRKMSTSVSSLTPDMMMDTALMAGTLATPISLSTGNAPLPLEFENMSSAGLTASQEEELLRNFFLYIHPSITLFDQGKFFRQYHARSVPTDLVQIMTIMTSKILNYALFDDDYLELAIKELLEKKILESYNDNHQLGLDDFRQACLLAYFSFHQFPGKAAWLRIGDLCRKAYQYNLHNLDNANKESPVEEGFCTPDELDEWRYIWWCVFCLDSYSNITASTPFVIETESVVTALPVRSLLRPDESMHAGAFMSGSKPANEHLIFLSPDLNELWRNVKEVMETCSPDQLHFNMQIITVSLVRGTSSLRRQFMQNPSPRLEKRVAALGDQVAAVRLAVVPRYLNPARRTLESETSLQHHQRLGSLLHISLARLITPKPPRSLDVDPFLEGWTEKLEVCEDIVAIVKVWDSQYIASVDPAICFIILKALLLLHMHKVGGMHNMANDMELQDRLQSYLDVLMLFLRQYATSWKLPNFLINLIKGPLSSQDIQRISREFRGPLHHKWLSFLSVSLKAESSTASTQINAQAATIKEIDPTIFLQDLSFNSWEDFAGLPRNGGYATAIAAPAVGSFNDMAVPIPRM